MCITAVDSPIYQGSSLENELERQAREKKYLYLWACIKRHPSLAPLVYSVEGIVVKEAKTSEKRVASVEPVMGLWPVNGIMGQRGYIHDLGSCGIAQNPS